MFGKLAKDETQVFDAFCSRVSLEGARVIEIGGSIAPERTKAVGVREWHAVDPLNTSGNSDDRQYVRHQRSASSIPVEDGYFDFGFSSNAFEHIKDIPSALKEVARLLRPGGVLYSHFGPIWSAPDGHHLEAVLAGECFEFWRNSVIPHWAHLALDELSLTKVLSDIVPSGLAKEVAEWVFHSSWLNRLSFEDYLTAFCSSPLHLIRLETSDEIDYQLPFPHESYGYLRGKAAQQLGIQSDIYTRDMLVVLKKR